MTLITISPSRDCHPPAFINQPIPPVRFVPRDVLLMLSVNNDQLIITGFYESVYTQKQQMIV